MTRERTAKLALLKDGWMNGDGVAFDRYALEWLQIAWDASYPTTHPKPIVFPTLKGEVEMEWTIGDRELIATVNLQTKKAFLCWWKSSDVLGVEHESTADLGNAVGWKQLAEFVAK